MMTYFAQVERVQTASDPRDPVVLWLGTTPREYTPPETMAESLSPYLELTPEILATLAADRRAGLDRGPTPLQRVSADLFPQPETTSRHNSK
jgi:hypothetical protein